MLDHPKQNRENLRRLIPLAALLITALTAGCENAATSASPPTPVRISPAERYEENAGLRYSANIEALTQVNLAFKSGGYIEHIVERRGSDGRVRILQSGDRVTQGEVLAHVRESEYADRVNSAKAQLDQAQANYDKAKLDFERASNLLKSDSLTKAQFDATKAAYDSGAAAVENAKAALEQAKTALSDCSL